jgi:uncharacterized protein YrzB (UPF0473 family)
MTEENNEILTLLDEEGQEHNFVVLDILNVNEKDYVILLPTDDEGNGTEADEPEAIVFRLEEEGEGQSLQVVDDDQELEMVAQAWEESLQDDDLEEDDEN